MPNYTISTLKSDLSGKIHGKDLTKVTNILGIAKQAALLFLGETEPKELQRVSQITPQVFDGVFMYPAPEDYNSPIDLYPSAGRGTDIYENDFRRTSQKNFDEQKENTPPLLSERWINGTRYLLIAKYPQTGSIIQLDSFDSATDFTAGDDAGSLVANTLNFVQGSGALSVQLSGSSGTAYLEKTNLTTQDLTDLRALGAWFIRVYIPSGYSSRFTSFTMRHGNDTATNYWSKQVTTQHNGLAFQDGWNLLRFDWSSATENGTVDELSMDAMRITTVYSAGTAIPGVLFDDFNVQLGTMYDLDYYSNYFFRTASGTWIDTPTENTDIINVSSESYMVYLDFCLLLIQSEITGLEKDLEETKKRIGYPVDPNNEFKGTLGAYKKRNPSQKITQTMQYYHFDV